MSRSADSVRESGRGYYVYAVARARDVPSFDDVSGVDPRFRVGIVEHDGLAAIVSEVGLDEFGEGNLEENLARPAWLEEKARAHDRVVARALAADALLPMRFATIFSKEEHVRDTLARQGSAFAELLERVHGKREWGVKAFFSPDDVRRWAEASLDEATAEREEAAGTGGRSYFARKKLERLVDDEAARATARCAKAAHARLAASASDARVNQLQRRELTGRSDEMLLNAAYLVPREREERFRGVVAALGRDYGDAGITFELTGPWPPYNFVRNPTQSGEWKTS